MSRINKSNCDVPDKSVDSSNCTVNEINPWATILTC